MRPPISGVLRVTQLFGGNPASEAYVDPRGRTVIGHDGIDVACAAGTPVFPAWPGVVSIVDDGAHGFGLHVFVNDLAHGRWALYAHLSAVNVSQGATVQPHTPFALSGSSGNSTGPHIHFGVYHGITDNGYGGAVDPLTDFDRDVWPLLDLSLTNL